MTSPSNSELAEQVAEFAAKMTPGDERWEYAYRVGTGVYFDKRLGRQVPSPIWGAFPPLGRFLGAHPSTVEMRLRWMRQHGPVAETRAALLRSSDFWRDRDIFAVGPMEAW